MNLFSSEEVASAAVDSTQFLVETAAPEAVGIVQKSIGVVKDNPITTAAAVVAVAAIAYAGWRYFKGKKNEVEEEEESE